MNPNQPTSKWSTSNNSLLASYLLKQQSNRIGNLLSAARLKAGLSQAQLAEKLGIRQNMVSDYERGKRRLSSAMAKRMAKILKIKVDRIS